MSMPTHCQTCGEPVGHLWRIYLKLVDDFSKDRKESDTETPEYKARQVLIDKHGLDGSKQCCLYAHMVNHDLTNIIT